MALDKTKRLLVDSASLYFATITEETIDTLETALKDKCIGLTRDGVSISFTPDIREIDFDGKRGRKIAGMDRILGWGVEAECSALELSDLVLKGSLLEKTTSTSTKFDKYVPSKEVTYQDIVIVGNLNGSKDPCVIVVKNSYNEEGLAIETKDSDEGVAKMKFVGAYDLGSDEPPIDIYLPKADGSIAKASVKDLD